MEIPGHREEEVKKSERRKPSAVRKALAVVAGAGVLAGGGVMAHNESAPDEVKISNAENQTRVPERANPQEIEALRKIEAGTPFEILTEASADIQIQTTDKDYKAYSFDQPIVKRDEQGSVNGLIVALDHDPKVQGQPPTAPRLAPVDLGSLSEYGGRNGTLHFADNTYEVTVTIKPHNSSAASGIDPLNGPTQPDVIKHSDSGFVRTDDKPLTPAKYSGAGSASSVGSDPNYTA